MSDYIKREAVLRRIEEMRVKEDDYAPDVAQAIYDFVADMDATDVAPVKHGTWEKSNLNGFVRCSVCHDCYVDDDWIDGKKWQYCPHCGTKLDGGDNDVQTD
nr:MAG TPA: hydrogenase/urease nickel incorporation protein [Caudoviricetes sp.]